jgi:type I restriction enzyme S subunit
MATANHGWKPRPLGECADWLSGGTPSKSNPIYWAGKIPWVSAKDMKSFRLHDAEDHISDSAVGKGGKIVSSGTVLLLVRGMTLHKDVPVSIVMRDMAFNQDIKAIRSKPDVDNQFLAYWLLAHKPDLLAAVDHAGHGTGRLVTDFLKEMEVSLPPKTEQEAVVRVFSALDDKIELNRQMDETLEALAQTLFKSWFIDAAVIKFSKGWRASQLGEHVEVAKGLSYKGSGLADSGVPLHNLNSVYEGGRYKHKGLKHYTGEYRERHIIHPGDVIVANTEQGFDHLLIGFPAIVPKRYGKFGLFTHHIYRVRPLPDSSLTNHFIYLLLLTTDVREQVIGHTNGTTVNALPKSGIEQATFALPPEERITEFERIVAPMFDQQEILYEESRTLAELRDALLPKLLSGELRVPGVSGKMSTAD